MWYLRHERETEEVSETQDAPSTLDKSKVVVNLSKRNISPSEEQLLTLGLNYAIAPSKVSTAEMIAKTKATARCLDTNTAQKLRGGVAKVLISANHLNQTSHTVREEPYALCNLRNDDSIVILPADKGNVTVVMDKSQYSTKMNTRRHIPLC